MKKLYASAAAIAAAVLAFAVPAAANHTSLTYDPPPESGTVSYDAAPVDVPFSVDPEPFCIDPPPETATVAGDTITVDPPQRCTNPDPVSGTVTYDAPAVDVPYTHDGAPREVPIPDEEPPPAPEFTIFEEPGTDVSEIADGFRATIPGAADAGDTAYAQKDMGAQPDRVFVRSVVTLGQDPVSNIALLQVRDVEGDLVYEVYALGSNNTLGLYSPAGGLRSTGVNLNTGVVVPVGTAVQVEVSALQDDSIVVRVDGVDKITQTGLAGATTSDQRFLRVGIDHYDGSSANPVSVDHTFVGSGSTWLGNPSGGEPPPPPPPPDSFSIPAFNTTLEAGPGIGENGRVAQWRQYGTDNNSWVRASDGTMVPHLATPAPGQKGTVSGPRSWVWWECGSVTVPTNIGAIARAVATINPHNSSYDVGPSGIGGIGWGFGSGVTNVHIFYQGDGYSNGTPNSFVLSVNPSPSTRYPLVPNVVKGHRYDFCLEITLGRNDLELGLAGPGVPGGGIGNHPNGGKGRVRAFVDGVLAVDTGNRDTLQRATAPDGKTYTQTLMHRPWDGAYVVPGLPVTFTLGRTLTRVGTTLEEALSDVPPYDLRSEWGEGGGGYTDLAPLASSDFRAPLG